MITRFLHALLGAFLGALLAIGALYWVDEINWIFVGASAAVCAVLSFAWGESFLEWLRDIWWRT